MRYGKKTEQADGREADIRAALAEWREATRFFESVRDPELVDYAVYGMEAARRKYMFLLKHGDGGRT